MTFYENQCIGHFVLMEDIIMRSNLKKIFTNFHIVMNYFNKILLSVSFVPNLLYLSFWLHPLVILSISWSSFHIVSISLLISSIDLSLWKENCSWLLLSGLKTINIKNFIHFPWTPFLFCGNIEHQLFHNINYILAFSSPIIH